MRNPSLKNSPVIVGGQKRRGVVSAASYVARRYGVKSGMPIFTAEKLCPKAIFLPVDMPFYVQMSKNVMAIFRRFTYLVEQVSVDEAFLDVSHGHVLFGDSLAIAKSIKSAVKDELGLTCSVGIAENMFIAKLASTHCKPDGLLLISHAQKRNFLNTLPVDAMWGVGRKTEEVLKKWGIRYIKDLSNRSENSLFNMLKSKKAALKFYELSRGIDNRPVTPNTEEKSISNEITYSNDITRKTDARTNLLSLTDKVVGRLRGEKLRAKTVSIKIKSADFKVTTKSRTLSSHSNSTMEFFAIVKDLLNESFKQGMQIRLLGVELSNFSRAQVVQETFDNYINTKREMQKMNDKAVDKIRSRFGNVVHYADELTAKKPH
jgi:DNA polymerase-4